MGIDVEILIRARGGYTPPDPVEIDGLVQPITHADGYTHSLSSATRYYGPHYERGPWPAIAAYLLRLLADPQIDAVCYGGDCHVMEPVTLEWLTQMNLHYIDNAERPYRDGATRVERTAVVRIE